MGIPNYRWYILTALSSTVVFDRWWGAPSSVKQQWTGIPESRLEFHWLMVKKKKKKAFGSSHCHRKLPSSVIQVVDRKISTTCGNLIWPTLIQATVWCSHVTSGAEDDWVDEDGGDFGGGGGGVTSWLSHRVVRLIRLFLDGSRRTNATWRCRKWRYDLSVPTAADENVSISLFVCLFFSLSHGSR